LNTVHRRKKIQEISLLSVGENKGIVPPGKRICVTWEVELFNET